MYVSSWAHDHTLAIPALGETETGGSWGLENSFKGIVHNNMESGRKERIGELSQQVHGRQG